MSGIPGAVAGVTQVEQTHDHLAPVYAQFPLEVTGGSGVHLVTRDGRRVLDLYGGHAVAALGYGHPRWLAALADQAHLLAFQSNAVPLEVRARAAARLVSFAALPLETVFFCNTGAEANENALKLALRITGRPRSSPSRVAFTAAPPRRGRDLGRRLEVVWLSACALRRRVPAARATQRRSRAPSARMSRR
jgi:acetylornithine/succinyldiaminopimelate/putrescine aminotransferase